MDLIHTVSSHSTTGGLTLDRLPRTIILVRHGETRGNIDDKAQGHFDAQLTDLGLRQAEALAHRLEKIDIDAVYSSDLIRAVDTAAALIALRPDLEIQTRAGLREVYFGSYEDMRWSEIREEDPELHERWTNWKTRTDVKFPNGESPFETRQRVAAVADEIMTKHHEENSIILIVGHTGSLQPLFAHLLNLSTTEQWRFHFDNTSITALTEHPFAPNVWRAQMVNDTHHLNGFNSHG